MKQPSTMTNQDPNTPEIQNLIDGRSGIPHARAGWTAPGRRALRYALAVAACLLLGVFAYRYVLTANIDRQEKAGARRLEFFALSLEGLLGRNEALPTLIAMDEKLGALLDADRPATRRAADRYLESVALAAGISAVYLMNDKGLTLAASNWRQPVSFVGQDYSFRPYFQDATGGRLGRFYGIGATSGEAGYFLAAALRGPGGKYGVVAVKVALESFEEAMTQSGETVFVADREGVILLSSVPAWKYRVLDPLSPQTRQRLEKTKQYGEHALLPLANPPEIGIDVTGASSLRVDANFRKTTVSKPVGALGWHMVMSIDETLSRRSAVVVGAAWSLAAALLIGLVMYADLSRRRRHDRVEAQRALGIAHEQLEERIRLRTADLTNAKAALEHKVAQLKQTEDILRRTTDGAVQAGKLAVLGQMSAGMSHELNQPLAALRTHSDNAIHLLQHGRSDEARENLEFISQLAARMGGIVRQLKAFARNDPTIAGAVDVGQAIGHALMILESQRKETGAIIVIEPVGLNMFVRSDAVRLEQVLVNLIRNGLDEVAGKVDAAVFVSTSCEGGSVAIRIRDSGPGIAAEVVPHLFEPFFTTKPVGLGLGLGLTLSRTIVEGFGGTLEGANVAGGGAEFCITLAAAPSPN